MEIDSRASPQKGFVNLKELGIFKNLYFLIPLGAQVSNSKHFQKGLVKIGGKYVCECITALELRYQTSYAAP